MNGQHPDMTKGWFSLLEGIRNLHSSSHSKPSALKIEFDALTGEYGWPPRNEELQKHLGNDELYEAWIEIRKKMKGQLDNSLPPCVNLFSVYKEGVTPQQIAQLKEKKLIRERPNRCIQFVAFGKAFLKNVGDQS